MVIAAAKYSNLYVVMTIKTFAVKLDTFITQTIASHAAPFSYNRACVLSHT